MRSVADLFNRLVRWVPVVSMVLVVQACISNPTPHPFADAGLDFDGPATGDVLESDRTGAEDYEDAADALGSDGVEGGFMDDVTDPDGLDDNSTDSNTTDDCLNDENISIPSAAAGDGLNVGGGGTFDCE